MNFRILFLILSFLILSQQVSLGCFKIRKNGMRFKREEVKKTPKEKALEFLSLLFSLKGMSYFGGSSEKDAKNICEMVQRWAENQDEKTKKEFDKLLFNRKFQKK